MSSLREKQWRISIRVSSGILLKRDLETLLELWIWLSGNLTYRILC